ncbi:MAG TPA: MFS transporter [Candidatus Paceibacterota bacterium]|nr:MFS transporter [Candidatus Paceibacterota bacterium]
MQGTESTEHLNPLRWMVLLTVIIGTFLGRLDQSIVNLALPKIISGFDITVSSAGWIATAYIIANAIFVPIWGKLGDTIGRKRVYILGFAIFIFGSVLAGLSWNLGSMLVFRIIQAVASSADYPTAMAILAVTFTNNKERATALGIWSSSFGVASVFGPLLGGPLIDSFGWRSVFLVNLPVGIVGLLMALRYVQESVSEKKTVAFDWWGASTLGAALAALVLVLDQGSTWGWTAWQSNVSYLCIILFTGIFVAVERSHPEPIVDFKFFKSWIFNITLFNNFITFMSFMGSIFLIPIFSQQFLGYDATQSGLLFIPMAIFFMIGGFLGGKLLYGFRPGPVMFWSTLGSAFGIYFLRYLDARSGAFDIIWPLMTMAGLFGMGMSQRTNIIADLVPREEIGVASSILALVRNIGGAFGIAIFGTILTNLTNQNVLNLAQNSILHITTMTEYQTAIGLMTLKAQVLAYDEIFFIVSILLAIGAVSALWMKTPKKKELAEGEERIEIFAEA